MTEPMPPYFMKINIHYLSHLMTNQQNGMCAQRRLRSAWAVTQSIRVFAVRMKKAWVLSFPLSIQRRLWSDWADARLIRVFAGRTSFCQFCNMAAHFIAHRHVTDLGFWALLLSQSMTKATKWRAPSEDSDQPGHPPSLISLLCLHEETLGP